VNPNNPTILQDNDPVQNSKAARRAFEEKGISLFQIPARSPDLNCIENLFQQMKQVLRRQARRDTITSESHEAFSARVQDALKNFDTAKIDKLIDSMPKRVDEIVAKNGERLNY
jgi:transposase